MKKKLIAELTVERRMIDSGEQAPARVWDVRILPDGTVSRVQIDPETYRQQRAEEAKDTVAAIRHKMGITQAAFAKLLGCSLPTLRKWEQGASQPSGAARTLLVIASRAPDLVRACAAV